MPERILVVDDDPLMVRTLCDVLRHFGYEADGLASGEAAVEAVTRNPPAAVVMDIRMAGMSGVEALRQMRELRPNLPVILMTAHSSTEVLMEANMAGVDAVFSKPLALPMLLEILRKVI